MNAAVKIGPQHKAAVPVTGESISGVLSAFKKNPIFMQQELD